MTPVEGQAALALAGVALALISAFILTSRLTKRKATRQREAALRRLRLDRAFDAEIHAVLQKLRK